jgi:outer membrane protein assembly factor BamB
MLTGAALAVPPVYLRSTSTAAAVNVSQRGLFLQGQHSTMRPSSRTPIDWPEFHGDAARDGDQSANTVLSKANADSLVPVSGSGFTATGAAMSSPAVYHGRVYYATNMQEVVNGKNLLISTMYAVNAKTGQTIWSRRFPGCGTFKNQKYVFSSPAVTTGMVNGIAMTEVFIGRGGLSESQNGCLYDFNGQTGAVIWTYGTALPINSSPAIMSTNSGNIVVVGDNDGYVHAFSVDYSGPMKGSGVQLWSYDTRNDPPPPGYAQYCQPSPELCGDAVWSSPAEGVVLIDGIPHHYAYFGVGAETNTVGRVDAIDMDSIVNMSPILAWAFWDPHSNYDDDFGTVLVLTGTNGIATRAYSGMNRGDMYGLDAANGSMYFEFSVPAQIGNAQAKIHSTGTLVTINGTTELIFGSGCSPSRDIPECMGPNNGHIWAIDALSTVSSGTLVWQSQDFGGDIVSSPVVVNQGANAVVYVLGPWLPGTATRGDLLALDPTDGTVLADYHVFNQAYGAVSSPAIYGSRVFVTEGYSIYSSSPPQGGGLAAFQCASCP